MDSGGFCLLCGRRLKIKKNQKKKVFYSKCFNIMVKDIKNFHKIAKEKYGYKEIICGKTREEWQQTKEAVVLHFE